MLLNEENGEPCKHGRQFCLECHQQPTSPAGYQALIDKLDDYIDFLDKSSEAPISNAYVHGWRCPVSDIDKGILLRKEIQELREKL